MLLILKLIFPFLVLLLLVVYLLLDNKRFIFATFTSNFNTEFMNISIQNGCHFDYDTLDNYIHILTLCPL